MGDSGRKRGLRGIMTGTHGVCVGVTGKTGSTVKMSSDSAASYYADGQ